jgi:hypothetical protein
MSKSITSNLLYIQNLESDLNLLNQDYQHFKTVEVDDKIANVNSLNVFDKYNKERFTGSKDWHFRIDFFPPDTDDTDDPIIDNKLNKLNKINDNNLSEYYNKTPNETQFIHAKELSDNLEITINDLKLKYSQHNENDNYMIRISTNILFKENTDEIILYSNTDYSTIHYSYFINNTLIQQFNNTTSYYGKHVKTHQYFKGWNRIDIFLYHIASIKYDTSFRFHFNPIVDIDDGLTTIKDVGDHPLGNNYFTSKIEHFTAFFINSKELLPESQLIIKDTAIVNNNYYLQHDNVLSNTYKYSYHILEWNDNYSELKTISDYNSNITYTLDRIIIKNNSSSTLNNVWLEFNINNNNYSCNALQNIESQNEHIIYDLNFNIDDGDEITHSLSNLHSLIYSDYSIFFHISMKEPFDKQTKALEITNSIHQNSLFITNKGSVGIGTNDTGNYSLYVNNISNDIKGIFCADDLTILSDIRYKTDIKPITDASSKLLLLNGVSYKKNDSYELGLLAQEVQSVLPELVNNNNDELGVKYLQIIPLLIEGFKELKNEINKIKKII